MVTNNKKLSITEAELQILDMAVTDFINHGNSDEVCPRCGSNFIFSSNDDSYQIKCKTSKCLQLTCRGL